MTITRTTLLDLPVITTGTESGVWGDITNNGLTRYLDIAIAGMTNLTSSDFTAGALTIETTEGTASADNIVSTSAQYAGFRVSSLATNSTITVGNTGSAVGRAYRIINADSTYTLTFKATGQTGVTFQPGTSGLVAFNGVPSTGDFVLIGVVGPATATDNAVARFDGTTGRVIQNSAVTIADTTGDITTAGYVITAAGAAGTAAYTTSGDLNTGMFFPAADTVAFTEGGTEVMRIDSSGNVGIGTTSAGSKLDVKGTLRLSGSSSGYVGLAPAAAAGSTTYTLPSADGTSGQFLSTNGTGTLSWATASGGGGGGGTSVTVTQITATASQTTFTVSYTVGQLSVYLNGALLAAADYTATNGTSVVLATGAASGDIFTALSYATVSGLTLQSTSPFGTLVGSGAGAANTGVNNTFVGFEAGNDNTTGTNNTAVGYQALDVNTTGGSNTAIGSAALGANTTGADNTAVGYGALDANTTGTLNTAVGRDALGANTTASNSTAIGYNAMLTNTTGQNTAVGSRALQNNTTGTSNVAVGGDTAATFAALQSNTTGSNNVAVGVGALNLNTTGSSNTGIGQSALASNTTASNNTAIGFQSLTSNTTGANNTAVGYSALLANTTGADNSAVGYNALAGNTTGIRNIAMGRSALSSNTTGGDNVALGNSALGNSTTASNNTAVGYAALNANTTGTNNTAVGYGALDAMTIGSNAVAIGTNAFGAFNRTTDSSSPGVAIGSGAGSGVTTAYNSVIIGYDAGTSYTTGVFGIYIGSNSTASAGGATDELVIGTRTSTGKGDQTGFINANTGGNYAGNNSSSWSTTSDRRLKKNIVDNNEGLEVISQIRVRNFEYRLPEEVDGGLQPTDAVKKSGVQLGIIAQELAEVCPGCVTEESTGVLGVDSDEIFWHMVNAIKQLKAEIDQLKGQ